MRLSAKRIKPFLKKFSTQFVMLLFFYVDFRFGLCFVSNINETYPFIILLSNSFFLLS